MKKSIEVKGAIETHEELERTMGEYAAAQIGLERSKAEMEARILEVRKEFETELAALKLAAEAPFKQLELWARTHPEEFRDRKSVELVHGTIGYRTGMPRVTVKRGTDEDGLCKTLESHGFDLVVRTVRELDKAEIIRLAGSEKEVERHFAEDLARDFGLKVSQTERFFADAKEETVGE